MDAEQGDVSQSDLDRQFRCSRRRWLHYGGVSLATPWLQTLTTSVLGADRGPRRIKSCIFWFHVGGISQPDTFDMKPNLAENFRGEFQPISTNVPGMLVCEHLPRVAQQMDKLCVVRSMHHRMLCHNPGIYAALSGREVGESMPCRSKHSRLGKTIPIWAAPCRLI